MKKKKKKPQTGRQYLYNTYPTKDLKPEYVKNSHNSNKSNKIQATQ